MEETWYPQYKKSKWRCLNQYISLGIKSMPTYAERESVCGLFYSGYHANQSLSISENPVQLNMLVISYIQGTIVDSEQRWIWFDMPLGSL